MPYSGMSDSNLPESVKKLPDSKKKAWVSIFNETMERYHDEGKAMASAWSAIKKSFDEEELEKAGRRHSKTDMEMFDKVKSMMGEMMAMMDELRGKEMEDDMEKAEHGKNPKEEHPKDHPEEDHSDEKHPKGKSDMDMMEEMKSMMDKMMSMMSDMMHGKMEKRDIDPNVGGGVDRDKLKPSDFIDPENRRFPVMTPGDVSDATHSFGRMGEPKMPFDEFKRKLIALCRRKGFMDALPAEWKKELEKNIVVHLEKMQIEKQLIYGVVLKPAPFVDSQGDMVDEVEIEQAAHDYLETYRMYDLQHTVALNQDAVVPVESYIAPQDLLWDTPQGRKLVPKGSWVLVSHVVDPTIWEQVKQGNVNAYSIAGYCQAREVVNA